DLLDVRLGEVRVEGQDPFELGREPVLDAQAGVAGAVAAGRALVAGERVRLDREADALLHVLDARQGSGAAQVEDVRIERDAGPAQRVLVACDVAADVQAPGAEPLAELEAADGDRDLRGPAVRRALHGRLPDAVPVVLRDAVDVEAVRARAAGVDLEPVAE